MADVALEIEYLPMYFVPWNSILKTIQELRAVKRRFVAERHAQSLLILCQAMLYIIICPVLVSFHSVELIRHSLTSFNLVIFFRVFTFIVGT